jgi:hypothetical protein
MFCHARLKAGCKGLVTLEFNKKIFLTALNQ